MSYTTPLGVKTYFSGAQDYSVNPCVTIPLTYCAPAYVGYRGSIRRKLINNSEIGGNMRCTVVHRLPFNDEIPSTQSTLYQNNVDFLIGNESPFIQSANGSEVMLLRNNACMEFESPYYFPQRFSSTRLLRSSEIQSEFYYASQFTQSGGAENVGRYTLEYVATGEDFTLFFFLNCPRYYRWDMPIQT